ncbi:MAG: LptF/LptG family permease, partial [Verrucomicrobiota bacterium]
MFRLKLIDSYIGKQVLFATVFGVSVLSIVLVLGSVFQRLIRELDKHPEIGWGFAVEFMLNVLPYSLIFTVPWGFLTAILLCYGRLSADNELVALRMSGLSMPRICTPVFVIGLFMTAFTFWMNVDVSPRSKARIARIFFELATENPGAMFIDDEVVTTLPGYLAYSNLKYTEDGAPEGEYKLINFQLLKLNDRYRPEAVMMSELATIGLEGEDKDTLVIRMENAHLEHSDADNADEFTNATAITAKFAPPELPLEKLRQKHKKERPSMMTLKELATAEEETIGRIEEKKSLAEQLKTQLDGMTKVEGDNLTDEEIEQRRAYRAVNDDFKQARRDHERAIAFLSAIRTDRQKRFSLSLACVTFALIGIPLGISAQRRETSVGFAIS